MPTPKSPKRQIERIKRKKVLTDKDLEILAKHEHARYFGRVG